MQRVSHMRKGPFHMRKVLRRALAVVVAPLGISAALQEEGVKREYCIIQSHLSPSPHPLLSPGERTVQLVVDSNHMTDAHGVRHPIEGEHDMRRHPFYFRQAASGEASLHTSTPPP